MLLIFTILCVCFAQFNAIFGTIYAKKQVNSFNLLGTSNIDGDLSHTYNAKSLIECGAFCKAITNCNSYTVLIHTDRIRIGSLAKSAESKLPYLKLFHRTFFV